MTDESAESWVLLCRADIEVEGEPRGPIDAAGANTAPCDKAEFEAGVYEDELAAMLDAAQGGGPGSGGYWAYVTEWHGHKAYIADILDASGKFLRSYLFVSTEALRCHNQYGFFCPKCNATDEIHIEASVMVKLVYNGTTDEASDGTEWMHDSYAGCLACGWEGEVKDLVQREELIERHELAVEWED